MPAAAKDIDATSPAWRRKRGVPVCVAMSQTKTSPPLATEAKALPSARNATWVTGFSWAVSTRSDRPLFTSHRRSDLSSDAETSKRPSGEKATELTGPPCPVSVWRRTPRSGSQSRTVASTEPDASTRPRAAKASDESAAA